MAAYPTYPHNISNKDLCRDVRGRVFFDNPMVELLCRRLEELDGDHADEVERCEDRIAGLEQEVYDLKESLSRVQEDLKEAEATVDDLKEQLGEQA